MAIEGPCHPASGAQLRRALEAVWMLAILIITLLGSVHSTVYLNKWAVEIFGGREVADKVAEEYGFRNLRQIGSLENYYLFEQRKLVKRSTTPSRHHRVRLKRAPEVVWVEQQSVRRRFKREYKVELDRWKPKLNDPAWPDMWYLNQGARGGHDMNVIGAWRLGYSGKGVVVTILDDGIEHTHSDLQQNYDPDASSDINGGDKDPTPRYNKADENRHGTRCAGEVAAVANNSRCGVGVAFGARIGGVRMLDGDVSDVVEAEALSLNPQHIDIYSASWGPEDNGKVVDGPGRLAKEAFVQGILRGRGGKGSIYVWASGNGGSMSDSCSCDGYANSIYTLSVSSTSEFGTKPWYLEECSSTLAATYSSGENYRERKIVTTDLHNRCIDNHTGTSASAPLAAGICALALEANPDLTWRDMQYIVVLTSRSEPLRDAQWVINGIGRPVSHRYGYGLMDGQAMVLLAERWTTVPEQHICTTELIEVDQRIEGNGISVTLETDGCKDTANEINYLEHVQAKVSLAYSRRGDLQIHLVSPNGTRSTLLPRRKYDYQPGEFKNWSFMSVFYWGEQPRGTWTLVLENIGSLPNSGSFEKWQLIMYGTKDDPVTLKDTTPKRPVLLVPEQGESTYNYDFNSWVTLTGWNLTDLDHSKSGTTPVTKLKTHVTPKQRTKVGFKTTVAKGSRTTLVKSSIGKYTTKATEGRNVTESVTVTLEDVTQSSLVDDVTLSVIGGLNGTRMSESETSLDVTTQRVTTLDDSSLTSEEASAIPFICDIECTADGCTGPGPESCLACQHARFNGDCVRSCPPQTYYDSPSGSCHPCQLSCLQCTGPMKEDGLNCLTCDDGFFLYVDGNSSSCVEHCPLQHYADLNQKTCIPCSPNCLICVDDPMNCVRCADDYEFLNSVCVPDCDMLEFRDLENSCQSCDVSCETCLGPDASDCLTCAVDMLPENDLCVANCSDGYYMKIAEGGLTCEMCHPSCSSCFGPEDYECFSCFHPLKLFGASCVESCPTGYFEDHNSLCLICHDDCAACIGPQENDCLDCPPTRFYFDGKCAENCSEGLFPIEVFNHVTDGMTNRCEVCHGTCLTCSGGSPVDCIRCFKGLVLSSGRCVAYCEPHQYQFDDRCWECHDSCASCYGPLNENCLECQADYYLHGNKCVVECPHGYYKMEQQCRHCSPECDGCYGYGADECTSCADGFVIDGDECVLLTPVKTTSNCSLGQFYNYADLKCENCHESCKACNGTGEDHCLSCSAPKLLHLETRKCLPCCTDIDNNQDVPLCCTCDFTIGLCLYVWENLQPEMTSVSSGNMTSEDLDTEPVTSAPDEISSTQPVISSPDPQLVPYLNKTTSVTSASSHHRPHSTKRKPTKTTTPSTSKTSPYRMIASSSPPLSRDATRHIEPEETDGVGTLAISPVTSTPFSQSSSGLDVTEDTPNSGSWSLWILLLFLVLCFATVCAIVFVLVFCCIQAKANDKLCWSKQRYHPVPVLCHNHQDTAKVCGKVGEKMSASVV